MGKGWSADGERWIMGIYSGVWCEKGVSRRLCKNALRVCGETKEIACVFSFWLAKPLALIS